MTSDKLLASLLAALGQNPQDQTLRLHVAELLLDAGRPAEALGQLTQVLTADPADTQAIALLQRATALLAGPRVQPVDGDPAPETAGPVTAMPPAAGPGTTPPDAGAPGSGTSHTATPDTGTPDTGTGSGGSGDVAIPSSPVAEGEPAEPRSPEPGSSSSSIPDFPASDPAVPEVAVPEPVAPEAAVPEAVESGYDWSAAEHDLGSIDHPFAQPAFVDDTGARLPGGPDDSVNGADPLAGYEVERPTIRLSDVGGMQEVKERLDVAFLTPMRNPELRAAFGKSLRGGLMLYGPPGCGKTFLARALAGELGARFASVSLADVLDMWVGSSERNVHQLFEAARQAAPCVVFLDEIDALGHKRSQMRGTAQRGSVNQLLTELDGVGSRNEGVFVLAASNTPWDVDPALRRPGRLDRTLLVLPPDDQARSAILRSQLAQRPVTGIDVGKLVKQTERYSGADLVHLVETAAERALTASVRSGSIEPITMRDLSAALGEVRPSTGAWFETARNVAEFANEHGEYDDLLAYLKRHRML